jgi:hypothetical protein
MGKMSSDEHLLLTLISSKSQTEAAQKLGISKQTVCRRVSKPKFKKMLADYRKQQLDEVNTKLIGLGGKSVDVLGNLLNSTNEISQYNSASRILGLMHDFIMTADIIQRLDVLEQSQKDESDTD